MKGVQEIDSNMLRDMKFAFRYWQNRNNKMNKQMWSITPKDIEKLVSKTCTNARAAAIVSSPPLLTIDSAANFDCSVAHDDDADF